jgi:enoyl-CoA hydratase/carnithine racemase
MTIAIILYPVFWASICAGTQSGWADLRGETMGQLTITDQEGVRHIIISNPPRGYMNAAGAAELVSALAEAEADDAVRVVLFSGGVPGVFIRHYDVSEIVAVAEAVRTAPDQPAGERSASPVYALFDGLRTFPKPTIAAINGVCMGGGFEFALSCDIRVAQAGGYPIGLPETRLGIIPGVGGLQLMSRVVGLARARELVMRGRAVNPAEAERLGLVHECAEDAVASAMSIAKDLAQRPPVGVAAVKRMARLIEEGESLEQGMRTAATEFTHTLIANDDAMEKMNGFLSTGEDILAD